MKKKVKKFMEMSRIELETSHMRSERSTTELHPQVHTLWLKSNNFFSFYSNSLIHFEYNFIS